MTNRIWTKSFIAICASSFFIFLNFYVLATALPLYVNEYLHGNQQQMGLVITLWSIGCVILRLFSGRWSDRFGKKKVSIIALSIFLLSSIFYYGVASIAFLFIIRIIHGGSYGVAATSTSALATDIIPESRKGEGIGYFSMFMSVAMVVGPALGIMVWNKYQSANTLFTLSAIISVLALVSTLIVKPNETAKQPIKQEKMSFKNLIDKNALPISLAGFILAISYSSLTLYITSYTKELDQASSAGLFFIVFALTIIISRPFIGKIFDRLGENFLAYPGLICFTAGMILLSQETSSTVLLLSAVIMGLGYGAILPCFQTIAIQSVSPERRGLATATFFLLFDAGYGVGSFLMGVIATHSNYRIMYFSAGVLALISLLIYYMMHHRQTNKSKKNMSSTILPKTS